MNSVTAVGPLEESITLRQAKTLIASMAHEQSFLLLSPPGVGKSEMVYQAAAEAGLPCRSLLGTQIAPEDVSGIPRIVGERSVFCPPRILLPETPEPFCLFLDELPACAPDVQKAFYSLLLERRVGEYLLPEGTWVVAAGNRAEDKALVRTISSALVNRVLILNVRIDAAEWLAWAQGCYTGVVAGNVISMNVTSATATADAFFGDPMTCAILMSDESTQIGVGVYGESRALAVMLGVR